MTQCAVCVRDAFLRRVCVVCGVWCVCVLGAFGGSGDRGTRATVPKRPCVPSLRQQFRFCQRDTDSPPRRDRQTMPPVLCPSGIGPRLCARSSPSHTPFGPFVFATRPDTEHTGPTHITSHHIVTLLATEIAAVRLSGRPRAPTCVEGQVVLPPPERDGAQTRTQHQASFSLCFDV